MINLYTGCLGLAIILIPVVLYLTYKTINEFGLLRGLYISKKTAFIDSVTFSSVSLKPIRTDIDLIDSNEHGLLIFDIRRHAVATTQKMYQGTSIGSIKIPGATIGGSNRKLYNKKAWNSYRHARVYVTNKNVNVYGSLDPEHWTLPIRTISHLRIVDHGNTVEIIKNWFDKRDDQTGAIHGRYKIKFANHKEAEFFINAVWTIRFNGWRLYDELEEGNHIYESAKDKILTRFDRRRYLEEVKRDPEARDCDWSKVYNDRLSKKKQDKAHIRNSDATTQVKSKKLNKGSRLFNENKYDPDKKGPYNVYDEQGNNIQKDHVNQYKEGTDK